jgi:hypothetical protein
MYLVHARYGDSKIAALFTSRERIDSLIENHRQRNLIAFSGKRLYIEAVEEVTDSDSGWAVDPSSIPEALAVLYEKRLCECGCGLTTPPAKRTDNRRGLVEGEPLRFFPGHQLRKTLGVPPEGYVVDPDTGCWNWMLRLDKGGYSRITRNGEVQRGHRVFYESRYGPVPDGLQLDHLCRNRRCVNPDHLEPVTGVENSRRRPDLKLSVEDARTIREALRSGAVQQALADQYGVSRRLIRMIRDGERWADV